MKVNNFTYSDVVLSTCERRSSVSKIAHESLLKRFSNIEPKTLYDLILVSEDNWITDDEMNNHFKPKGL